MHVMRATAANWSRMASERYRKQKADRWKLSGNAKPFTYNSTDDSGRPDVAMFGSAHAEVTWNDSSTRLVSPVTFTMNDRTRISRPPGLDRYSRNGVSSSRARTSASAGFLVAEVGNLAHSAWSPLIIGSAATALLFAATIAATVALSFFCRKRNAVFALLNKPEMERDEQDADSKHSDSGFSTWSTYFRFDNEAAGGAEGCEVDEEKPTDLPGFNAIEMKARHTSTVEENRPSRTLSTDVTSSVAPNPSLSVRWKRLLVAAISTQRSRQLHIAEANKSPTSDLEMNSDCACGRNRDIFPDFIDDVSPSDYDENTSLAATPIDGDCVDFEDYSGSHAAIACDTPTAYDYEDSPTFQTSSQLYDGQRSLQSTSTLSSSLSLNTAGISMPALPGQIAFGCSDGEIFSGVTNAHFHCRCPSQFSLANSGTC